MPILNKVLLSIKEMEYMAVEDNEIERVYRDLISERNDEFVSIYLTFPDIRLQIIFSALHAKIIYLFEKMNQHLPGTRKVLFL